MSSIPFPSRHILASQLARLCVFEQYVIEALGMQHFEPRLQNHAAAHALIARTAGTFRTCSAILSARIDDLPEAWDEMKPAAAAMAGQFVRFFRKTRDREVPDILRSDYRLLNLAARGYDALRAASMAALEAPLAGLAQSHRRKLFALRREYVRLSPDIAGEESCSDGLLIVPEAARAVMIDLPRPGSEQTADFPGAPQSANATEKEHLVG